MNMEAEDWDISEPNNRLYGYEPFHSVTPYSIIKGLGVDRLIASINISYE